MSTAPAVMTVLFLAILIWNVAFIAIDLGEEQPKKKAKHAKKKIKNEGVGFPAPFF